MKVNILLLLIAAEFVSLNRTIAQVLADDADGKSSIVQYSNSINFDLAKAALAVGINNYREAKNGALGKTQTLWGVTASAKNSDGLAALFNAGKLVPASRLQFFLGNRRRMTTQKLIDLQNEENRLANSAERQQYKRLLNYRLAVDSLIKNQPRLSLAKKNELQKAIEEIMDERPAGLSQLPELDSLRTSLVVKEPATSRVVDAVMALIERRLKRAANLNAILARDQETLLQLARDIASLDVRRYRLLYVAGGLNASSFNYYDPTVKGTLDDRFVNTPYRGGFIDLGINYDYTAHWLFGGSVGYERANTFTDNLTVQDYTVRTVDMVNNQQLITETKYTGYVGDFRLYDRANIRTDLLYFKALGKTNDVSGYQIAWNILYTRTALSFNQNVAKSRLDIGSGLNFYNVKKGSFLGGLYVQVTDLLNSQHASTNAPERLSFGIVAKYAFQSIANRFVNP